MRYGFQRFSHSAHWHHSHTFDGLFGRIARWHNSPRETMFRRFAQSLLTIGDRTDLTR
jgi:hypothetical protein